MSSNHMPPLLNSILVAFFVTSYALVGTAAPTNRPCELLLSGSTGDQLGALSNVGRVFHSLDGNWLTLTDRWSEAELALDFWYRNPDKKDEYGRIFEGIKKSASGPLRSKWVTLNLATGKVLPLDIEIPARNALDGIPARTENQVIYFKDWFLVHLHSDHYDAVYFFDYKGKRLKDPTIRERQRNQPPLWTSVMQYPDQNRVLVRNGSGYDVLNLEGQLLGKLGFEAHWHWRPLGDKYFYSISVEEIVIVDLQGEVVKTVKATEVEKHSLLSSAFRGVFGTRFGGRNSTRKFSFDLLMNLPLRDSLLIGVDTKRGGPYWAVEVSVHGNPEVLLGTDRFSNVDNHSFHQDVRENQLANTLVSRKLKDGKEIWGTELQIRDLGKSMSSHAISIELEGQWKVINMEYGQIVMVESSSGAEPTRLRVYDLKGRLLYRNDRLSSEVWQLARANRFVRLDQNRFLIQGEDKMRSYEIDITAKRITIRDEHIVAFSEEYHRLFVMVSRSTVDGVPNGTGYQVKDFKGRLLKDLGTKTFDIFSRDRHARFLSKDSLLVREREPGQAGYGKLRYIYWD